MAEPDLCFMEATHAVKLREEQLANAVIATPVSDFSTQPRIKDVCLALKTRCGKNAKPITISAFPPDFILEFPTPQIRDAVLAYKTIQETDFMYQLLPWSSDYRSTKIPMNTKVTVDIMGIPPHAFNTDCLQPLLHPYCDIQTYAFEKDTGLCSVNAYTHDIKNIPATRYLGLSYECGTHLQTFPVNLHAHPYMPPQDNHGDYWVPDPSKDTDLCGTIEYFDPELLEDPEVVAEAFAEQVRLQKLDEARLSKVPTDSSWYTSYSSDSADDPGDYDYATIDSDREPADWKGKW